MDAQITAAVIGAGATIVAAIIGAAVVAAKRRRSVEHSTSSGPTTRTVVFARDELVTVRRRRDADPLHAAGGPTVPEVHERVFLREENADALWRIIAACRHSPGMTSNAR